MIQLAEFEQTWHGFYQGIIYTPVSVAYLGGGPLCEGPRLWPDRRDFCNYFGIIFSAV